MPLSELIRTVPDFPQPGVQFRDLTPLLADRAAMRETVAALIAPFRGVAIDAVAGMEARGFVFGALAAWELGTGFVPLRKPGKLPYRTYSLKYDLEYGSAELQVHIDGVNEGARVLLIDDLLATGGTMRAGCQLIEKAGGQVAGCAFLVELTFLHGREVLRPHEVFSLIRY